MSERARLAASPDARWRAAETLESVGGVWLYSYASDRSRHRRGGTGGRSETKEAEFEASRAEGRAMGFERAVAHALGRSTVVPARSGER